MTECPVATFGDDGALTNADEAIGELVNTTGAGMFAGYYNDPEATDARLRHGMYWSGDLAYRDADGWIYFAGRSGDWLRVDGENMTTAPIERILQRLTPVSHVAVYAVPDEQVGDQVMAAIVLSDDADLTPEEFGQFLADQPDFHPRRGPGMSGSPTDCRLRPPTRSSSGSWPPAARHPTAVPLWTRSGQSWTYEVHHR